MTPSQPGPASESQQTPLQLLDYASAPPSRLRMWVSRAISAPVRHASLIAVVLTEAAQRLITLGIWLLAVRMGLAFFSYETGVAKLLPWALTFLNAALVCEFAAYWLSRLTRGETEKARSLLVPTLALVALTAAWMIFDLAAAP